MIKLRNLGAASVVALLAAWGWTSSALASGGASIASAPTVVYGQQEFGNLASDNGEAPCDISGDPIGGSSWWNLPVTAGDRVTIDYEGDLGGFYLFPVGTTDFALTSTDPFETSHLGSNGKQRAVFTAGRSGSMPLDLGMNDGCYPVASLDPPAYNMRPGPYDFTAYVLHKLVLSMSARSNRRQHRTYLYVGAHNPDGVPITNGVHAAFQLLYGGRWHPTGTYVHWTGRARGKWWRVRAQVAGSGYVTATESIRVKGV